MGQQLDDELQMYKHIERGSKNHPGHSTVRSLLDSFNVNGPKDKHQYLIHPPLWDSVLTFLHHNPEQRLPTPVLAFVLKRLFLALNYLHTECQIIHTGIYSNSIIFFSPFLLLTSVPIRHQGRQYHVRHRRRFSFQWIWEKWASVPLPKERVRRKNNLRFSGTEDAQELGCSGPMWLWLCHPWWRRAHRRYSA